MKKNVLGDLLACALTQTIFMGMPVAAEASSQRRMRLGRYAGSSSSAMAAKTGSKWGPGKGVPFFHAASSMEQDH